MNYNLPRWLDIIVLPLANLLLALVVAGGVLALVGNDPLEAGTALIRRAFFHPTGFGYTLYYATSYIFTGLAVAVAFHAGLFNIGGEGQALVAGVGVAIAAFLFDQTHWLIVLPTSILLSMAFGAFWAFIPGILQTKRGSHVVITTIMMNFIAMGLLSYLVSKVINAGPGFSETRIFGPGATIPRLSDFLGLFGIKYSKAVPLNVSFIIAIFASVMVYIFLWRTRLGYALRAFGHSESAANYAGISRDRIVIIAMIISGALAGLMANNVVLGSAHKLGLNDVVGAGFLGIAVALMGRNHPVGIFLAALLFGGLVEGGSELQFSYEIPKDIILVTQGLVILFVGALDHMIRIPVTRAWIKHKKAQEAS